MGLLKTLAIFIIVYYIFKFLSKLILPLFLKKVVSNMEEKMKNQQQQNQRTDGEVGETIIDKKPQDKSISNKNVGEYVDYEEVKDE
ncbi:MAG TPA: DUF4834 family protein [Flavobacteriaceae bacterium]|nr:DUF4834 family protein [Flavobacteriaceae bacterium]